eukprot:12922846-Prorocentrum_lima.AAC.1
MAALQEQGQRRQGQGQRARCKDTEGKGKGQKCSLASGRAPFKALKWPMFCLRPPDASLIKSPDGFVMFELFCVRFGVV